MWFLIGSAILTVIGIILYLVGCNKYNSCDTVGGIIAWISGIALFIFLILLPINIWSIKVHIAQLNAFELTVETQRQNNISGLERVALTQKVADWNEWIAARKYWNGTSWGIYVPDEVMDLEYIK